MTTVTTAFTATGVGANLFVAVDQSFTYEVTGTFVATWVVELTKDQVNFEQIGTATGTGTQAVTTLLVSPPDFGRDNTDVYIRFRCSEFTSGTMTTNLVDVADPVKGSEIVDANGLKVFGAVDGSVDTIIRTSQQKVITSGAKVGGTAGAVVDAANDKNSLVKVPASQTASTIVVKIPDLKVGDTITDFSIYGQLESAGGAVTVDADLRAQTAVAADNTDASVGAITQVSQTADYLINDAKTGLTHTVIDGNSYYVLITVTTAASTDVDLLGITVTVTES